MEPNRQADGEKPASSGEDAGTATDTAEHHNDVSAFEESIDREELEEAVPSVKESEGEPAQEMNVREITNYLDYEVRGRSSEDHFCELYNQSMARNCFT